MTGQEVCSCRHPWSAHELVSGMHHGRRMGPDIWVCSGGRLADVSDPDVSPWDFVCGCILHEQPPSDGLGLKQEARAV